MSKFLTELETRDLTDSVFELTIPLTYESDLLKCVLIVPAGFQSDRASVPRIPIAYMLFGDKAHREACLHDYLYRSDSIPVATRKQADDVFYESMKLRGKSWFVRWCMWSGVRLGGWTAFHDLKVKDTLLK